MAVGGVVRFYALRATLHYARHPGLYRAVETHGGESLRLVLGAEPFLLVVGAVLLVAADVRGWWGRPAATRPRPGRCERTAFYPRVSKCRQ